MLKSRALAASLGLLLLCSCGTDLSTRLHLPADVRMNKEAGHRSLILVNLRLASGEELPMILDTGASVTCLDISLESKLGERLHAATNWTFGVPSESGVYSAPTLYLGNTPLKMTGSNIITYDCKQFPPWVPRPVVGALGMDCLVHYCLQLDFESRKIRFLEADHSNTREWGQAFPLVELGDGLQTIQDNLIGINGSESLIDTGCSQDGWLAPKLFQQWTNQVKTANGEAHRPNGVMGGQTYPEIAVIEKELLLTDDPSIAFSGVGLRFLSRHLVTFDFPNRRMYLKRVSLRPLAGNWDGLELTK